MNRTIAAKWGKRIGGWGLVCAMLSMLLLPGAAGAAKRASATSEEASASSARPGLAPKEPDLASEAAVLIDAVWGDERIMKITNVKLTIGVIVIRVSSCRYTYFERFQTEQWFV